MHLPSLLDDLGGPSPSARAAVLAESARDARPLPRLVAWNLARRCAGAACVPCLLMAGAGGGAIGELSTIESLHLAHQIVSLHPALVVLSGGDVLAREDVETIAAHSMRRGASVAIATPGGRLTEKRLDTLQGAGVSGVIVVLPRPDAASLKASGHAGGAAAEVLASVARARLRGLRVVVSSLLSEASREAAAELARWSAGQGAHALHVELAGDERGMLAAERELAVHERRLARSVAVRVTRRGSTCACDSLACRVTADGKLTACPCAPAVLADLRRQPFAAAWFQSPVLQERRERAAAAQPPPEEPQRQQLSLALDALPIREAGP